MTLVYNNQNKIKLNLMQLSAFFFPEHCYLQVRDGQYEIGN